MVKYMHILETFTCLCKSCSSIRNKKETFPDSGLLWWSVSRKVQTWNKMHQRQKSKLWNKKRSFQQEADNHNKLKIFCVLWTPEIIQIKITTPVTWDVVSTASYLKCNWSRNKRSTEIAVIMKKKYNKKNSPEYQTLE